MTHSVVADVAGLRGAMSGPVLQPGDDGYDEARKVWNAEIDRRPAVIAQCRSAADVSAAVRYAVAHNLEIAVRGGAHAPSGKAVCDDGLMIELSGLNHVTVEPESRRAHAGGGALLADLQGAAQQHGLGLPVGSVGHTGVGGLTLGGGQGWLSRKHGLTLDNLISAEVVLADGSIVRASDEVNADLFWALRGGGGNFGVVTDFEFALHPAGPMVEFGFQFWTLDQGKDFLRAMRDVAPSLPAAVNIMFGALNAPPAPFVPEEHQFVPGYAFITVGFGAAEDRDDTMRRAREAVTPLFEFAAQLPFMMVQTMIDEANAWGHYDYEKGGEYTELTDEVIDILTEHVPRKSSPLSAVLTYRMDGAFSEIAEDATAYSGERKPCYSTFIVAVCPTTELFEADRAWVRELYGALRPHLSSRAYINALGDEADAVALYGDEKYARLAQIKRKYDPNNVFRRNHNIRPAPAVPAQGS